MAHVELFHLMFDTRGEKSHLMKEPRVALLDTMIFEDLLDWAKGRRMPGSGARLSEVLRSTAGMTVAPGHAMVESAWARQSAITEIDLYQAHTILAMLLSARHRGERWLHEGPPGVVRAVFHQIPTSAALEPYVKLIDEGQQAWFLSSAIPLVLLRHVQQGANKGDRPERRVKLFAEYSQYCVAYGGGLDPWSSTLALVRLFQRKNDKPLSRLVKGLMDARDPSELRSIALNVARDVSMLRSLLDIEIGTGGHDAPRSGVLLTRDRGLVGLHDWVGADVVQDGAHAGLRMDRLVDGLKLSSETKSTLVALLQDQADGRHARVAVASGPEMVSVEVASKRLDAAVRFVTADS